MYRFRLKSVCGSTVDYTSKVSYDTASDAQRAGDFFIKTSRLMDNNYPKDICVDVIC